MAFRVGRRAVGLLLGLSWPMLVLADSAASSPRPLSARSGSDAWCGVRAPGDFERAPRPPQAASVCADCPVSVSYRAFDGSVYSLNRFVGRFTELLLPDGWVDGNGLDSDARRLFVDRADFIYQHAAELLGREPGGEGALQIAFVPLTCGFGCGSLGSKGVEIVSSDAARDEVRADLAAGVLPRILVHEMAHNFDLLNEDLWQGPPSSFDFHAWTAFFEPYLQIYTRMGSSGSSPDEVQASWVESTLGAYLRDPAASFQRCIAETACGEEPGTANRVWAGVTHRFLQLEGPHAARPFLAALLRLRAERGVPVTLQQKADLHFEALSDASGTDLGCYADAWRWSISDSLRARMQLRPPDPRCIDLDGDGSSPLLGDCDDDDEQVGPASAERDNGRDDDCDGLVDEAVLTEALGGDFPPDTALPFPARVAGDLDAGDADSFWLDNPEDRDVAFTLCSQGFQGWLFVYEGSRWAGYQYTPKGQCSKQSYALTRGPWRVSVELNSVSEPGAYTLSVGPGTRWPLQRAAPQAPQADQCRLVFEAEPSPASPAGTPDRSRLWISGRGFVAEASQAPPARAALDAQALAPVTLRLRTQPFEGDVPVDDWSAALTFGFAPPPEAACGQDPDLDGVGNGADVCPSAYDPAQADGDADGVGDACDDCIAEPDGPLLPDAGGVWQRDSDGDGFGNVCDPDLDGNGVVNFRDLARLKAVFLRSDPDGDLDGDGVVNFRDLADLKRRFLKPPGPSALAP